MYIYLNTFFVAIVFIIVLLDYGFTLHTNLARGLLRLFIFI